MTRYVPPAPHELRQLEATLAGIEPLLKTPELSKYVRDRLSSISMDLLRLVGSRANSARLESAARAAVALDFASLLRLLESLIAVPEDALEPDLRDAAPDKRRRLETAKKLIETTGSQLAEIDPMEIGLRLELYVDRALADFLIHLKRESPELAKIVVAAQEKLARLDERSREKVWASITRELRFGPEDDDPWRSGLPLAESVVERSFFDGATPDTLAHLIAEYVVVIRPRLVHAAFAAGAKAVPMPPVSVARILASRPDADAVTGAESRLIGHIMLLAHLMSNRLFRRDDELAAALGIAEDSRLLHGEPEKRVRELVPDSGLAEVMIAELRGAALALSAMIGGVDDPELGLLIRYKRGLEVALPGSRKELIHQNEIELQKRLCAFLIQHGADAVGTRFGQAETDIVTGSELDPLVIEAKVFRSSPKRGQIEKAFTQLRGYMDQAPYRSRGALAFFNFSDVPIHATREILGGRIAVVSVNLPEATPSQQESYIEVREGPIGGSLLEVLSVGVSRPHCQPARAGSLLRRRGGRQQ